MGEARQQISMCWRNRKGSNSLEILLEAPHLDS
ncbi:hypothetical protein Nmel_018207 [Mimus melanotis]